MKVSIIVPMYNCSDTIERCINSVLNQSYKDLELLLINDGSKDNIENIIEKYLTDKRVKYVYKENGGVSSARNTGINLATGDYITFIDPDDMLAEDSISRMVEVIERNNCDFVKFNYYLSNKENLKLEEGKNLFEQEVLVKNIEQKNEILNKILKGEISTFVWVLILKKSFMQGINRFNENVNYMEDKIFYIDIFSKSNNYCISNIFTYHYFFKEFNNKTIEYWNNYLKNVNIVFEQLIEILQKNNCLNDYRVELIKSLGASQLNEIIYRIFCIDEKLNLEKTWKLCSMKLTTNLKTCKEISTFSKICLSLLNKNKYNKLKILYKTKKIMKKRGKE